MTGPSHREPLDEHERELARVLRALPAGEPPAALDQRILRAAADAAAAPRRTRHRWLAFGGGAWGIGGAAAAVLALGVSWHLIDPTRNAPFERASAPSVAAESDDAVTVTLAEPVAAERASAEVAPDAAAVPPTAVAPGVVAGQPRERAPVARARSAAPAPAAAPVVAPPVASPPPPPPPPPQPQPQPPESFGYTAGTDADIPMADSAAPAPVEPPQAVTAQALGEAQRAESARESDALAAERRAKATADASRSRGAMTPAVWIAQVRSLRDAQRRAEAAESLRRFRQYYPQYAIPADLLPLLRE